MERIRIGVAHWGAGLAPVFAAVEGGFLRDQGLLAELVPVPGHPAALAVLDRGEVDFVNSVAVEVVTAAHRHGSDAAIVASAIGRSAQQVAARPGLKGLEALRGRRWGVIARGDPDECSIAMAFARWGWSYPADAEIVAVGADEPRLDLLLDAERVDAAIMHPPEPYQAERLGWSIAYDLARLDVAFQNSCAVTSRRLLRERPETALRYVRAYLQAVWRFRTDALFGTDVLREHMREPDRGIIEATWTGFARVMGGTGYPSLEGIRNAAAVLCEVGVLPGPPPPPEGYVDLGPVEALEREGFFGRIMGLGRA